MDNETVVTAPSAVQESPVSAEIPRSGTAEYTKWRIDGTLPQAKPSSAETAPADAPKEATPEAGKAESAGESGAPKDQQEQPKPKAKREQREAQLRSKIEQEWEKAEPDYDAIARFHSILDRIDQSAGQKRKAEPAPVAQQQPSKQAPAAPRAQSHNFEAWHQNFIDNEANSWMDQWATANPGKSYESGNAAMYGYMRSVERQFEQAHTQRQNAEAKAAQAQSKYGDFYQVKDSFFSRVIDPNGNLLIPGRVLERLDESEVMTDLIHAIGSNEQEVEMFIQMARTNPRQAERYILQQENLILEESSGSKASPSASRNERGQFVAQTPAKRGPESAPEPPLEIGSRGAGPADDSERALKSIERGDSSAIRQWMQAENAKDLRRRKGL